MRSGFLTFGYSQDDQISRGSLCHVESDDHLSQVVSNSAKKKKQKNLNQYKNYKLTPGEK